MATDLIWIDGPWPGRLALSARPRGGDWLRDELAHWQGAGVHTVLSLLTSDEERDLALEDEADEVTAKGMQFLALPIPDRQVPPSEAEVAHTLEKLDADLASGRNAVHCRQGIGRTGLIAACLLVMKGWSPGSAVETLTAARGVPVPETAEQRRWIDHYASLFAGTK